MKFEKNRVCVGAVCAWLSFFVISTFSVSADVLSQNEASDIQEPAGVYDRSADIIDMNVRTVISGGACAPNNYRGCTLNDVLNDLDATDDFKPEVKVHFSADDYDGAQNVNATMRQRGGESRGAPQKSFRIKLNKNMPKWRGEKRIQLVKSGYDQSRIRNKLSYDLFVDIPHLPSMRTQFVRLNVNDDGNDQDYGLYTQVEYVGKDYLKRRGWDSKARLYKPEDFGYFDEPEMQLDGSGKPLNKAAYETIVDIKNGKNHQNLYNLIQDLNDDSVDFNSQIMGKYFNLDNYLTWFAVNILFNNQDTHFHNYYLYNPSYNEKFYLIPWDYDSVLGMVVDHPDVGERRMPRWWFSHANFWEIQLHMRFLSEPGNIDLLAKAVTEIKRKYLSQGRIAAKRDAYYDVVFPALKNSPDWDFMFLGDTDPEQVAAYNEIFDKLSRQVDIQYNHFMARLYDPMTFSINTPQLSDNDDSIHFSWSESTSLVGQQITYDLDIATDREFRSGAVLEHITGISDLSYDIDWRHPKGTYFFRVIARDVAAPQSHWQVSRNAPLTYANSWVELFGVLPLVITRDGDPDNAAPSQPEPSPQAPQPSEPTSSGQQQTSPPSEPTPSQQEPSTPAPSQSSSDDGNVPSQSGGGSMSWGILFFWIVQLLAAQLMRKRLIVTNNLR